MKDLEFNRMSTRWRIEAKKDGIVLGHCTLRIDSSGLLTIWGMNVHYHYRRKGVASALIAECKTIARRRNMPLQLRVQSENRGAYALYKKNGFKAQHGKITMRWKP